MLHFPVVSTLQTSVSLQQPCVEHAGAGVGGTPTSNESNFCLKTGAHTCKFQLAYSLRLFGHPPPPKGITADFHGNLLGHLHLMGCDMAAQRRQAFPVHFFCNFFCNLLYCVCCWSIKVTRHSAFV